MIPYYPKVPSYYPHIETNNEQNLVTTHDSHTSDMIQNYRDTSCDNFEMIDNAHDEDAVCNDYDDTSNMFDKGLYNCVNLDHYNHHPSPS